MRWFREVRGEGLQKSEITCVFCRGTGSDPFAIATCYVCKGKKKVMVANPNVRCSYCSGTGVSPIGGRNACQACYGVGFVPIKKGAQTCPKCGGTGEDKSSLYCLRCHGSGKALSMAT